MVTERRHRFCKVAQSPFAARTSLPFVDKPLDPTLLSRGKTRRLEKRFASLDADINRRIGVFAVLALAAMVVAGVIPQRLAWPEWLSRTVVVAWAIGIVPAFGISYSRAAAYLSRKHGLRCSQCGKPLRRLLLSKVLLRRRRFDDPDYCVDGKVPSRCPYCHASISSATEQKLADN
ncbi:hypothetical protein Rcae01_06722 [Novipirellula caenicola]|uniref:Uncharacterized protein n=1 Tax=Novipirellula caenicola TaxID=1536901 RepID=A0ABP9W2H3_9BACT